MNIDGESLQGAPVAFSPDEAPAPGGIGATVSHRLGRCVERLENPELKPGWVVHEVRKDLKRVRALLRLSGDMLRTRRPEKRCAAAARKLSHLRDAAALGETLVRLRARADAAELESLDVLAEALLPAKSAADHAPALPRPVALEVAETLRKVKLESEALPFERMDAAALDAGLAESWSDSARAFRRVVASPVLPHFHDLRKAVKRELHQSELAGRPVDPVDRATLKKMADVLGELQDLDVLRDRMRAAKLWRGPVRKLVTRTIRELKGRALRISFSRYPESGS